MGWNLVYIIELEWTAMDYRYLYKQWVTAPWAAVVVMILRVAEVRTRLACMQDVVEDAWVEV